MTYTPNQEEQVEIENLKIRLGEQRITDFVNSLVNEEDITASRSSMISVVSKVLNELMQIETAFVKESVAGDEVCPGCLIANTTDLVRLHGICDSFNAYITANAPLLDETHHEP